MSDKYVVDAYTWVEYLDGSRRGEKLRSILTSDSEIFTSAVTLAEVTSKAIRTGRDHQTAYNVLHSNSTIIDAGELLSLEAGILHADIRRNIKDFGLADAYVMATARRLEANILTGDPHFNGFKEAVMV